MTFLRNSYTASIKKALLHYQYLFLDYKSSIGHRKVFNSNSGIQQSTFMNRKITPETQRGYSTCHLTKRK